MLTDLAWDRVSERKPPQRAGYASLSNTAQNASLPVSQSFLAEPLLQRFLWASCWCRQFFFFCFFVFLQEDGAWPPSGGQSGWPCPGELRVCLQWFYSAPFSITAGCDPDRCGTANADSIEKPEAYWEALIKGGGCFCFALLSLCEFNSQISLLKLCLLKHMTQRSWRNARELCYPQKIYSPPTMAACTHHSRAFCYYLAPHKAE